MCFFSCKIIKTFPLSFRLYEICLGKVPSSAVIDRQYTQATAALLRDNVFTRKTWHKVLWLEFSEIYTSIVNRLSQQVYLVISYTM